jgi:hypothetical protein
MNHEREFSPKPEKKAPARDLAAAYSRLFATDDGKRVLADLMAKFDPLRSRFGDHCELILAARIDGQCDVMREIREAMAAGVPSTGILPTNQP